jgi:diamine N-acetyltransferase
MEHFTESIEKIKNSNLPADIQTNFLELLANSQAVIDRLPGSIRRRTYRMIDNLVDELIEPDDPIRIWELVLDLLTLEASKTGEMGRPILEISERLRPQLREFYGPDGPVRLEKINMETVWPIILLSDTLREPQSLMVAPNVVSLAQAHFNEHAWFRGIFAGKAPVGFMMIVDDDQTPEYFLWRFMIGHPYQGRGYGRDAIELLVEYVRSRPGAKELGVSCGEGPGSPEGFYRKSGFIPTGEKLGDEIVLKRSL